MGYGLAPAIIPSGRIRSSSDPRSCSQNFRTHVCLPGSPRATPRRCRCQPPRGDLRSVLPEAHHDRHLHRVAAPKERVVATTHGSGEARPRDPDVAAHAISHFMRAVLGRRRATRDRQVRLTRRQRQRQSARRPPKTNPLAGRPRPTAETLTEAKRRGRSQPVGVPVRHLTTKRILTRPQTDFSNDQGNLVLAPRLVGAVSTPNQAIEGRVTRL